MSDTSSSSGGIGFFGLLQIIFICGKLFELGALATWSWWAVFIPTFMVLLAIIIILLVVVCKG